MATGVVVVVVRARLSAANAVRMVGMLRRTRWLSWSNLQPQAAA